MSWFLRRGRLGRKPFWLEFFLPMCAAGLAANRLDVWLFGATGDGAPDGASLGEQFAAGPCIFVVSALLAVPLVSSSVTRFHDTGRSAWWLLALTIPVAGPFVYLYLCSQRGEPFPNQYGLPSGGVVPSGPAAAPLSGGYDQQPGLH